MKRKEFIRILASRINFTSDEERNNILNYYDELIIEKIEDGEKEEDVIASLGSVEYIVRSLNGNSYNTSTTKLVIDEKEETHTESIKQKQKEKIKTEKKVHVGGIIGYGVQVFVFFVLISMFASFISYCVYSMVLGVITFVSLIPDLQGQFDAIALKLGSTAVIFGLSLIFLPLFIMALKKFIKCFIRAIKGFFGSIFGRRVTV